MLKWKSSKLFGSLVASKDSLLSLPQDDDSILFQVRKPPKKNTHLGRESQQRMQEMLPGRDPGTDLRFSHHRLALLAGLVGGRVTW